MFPRLLAFMSLPSIVGGLMFATATPTSSMAEAEAGSFEHVIVGRMSEMYPRIRSMIEQEMAGAQGARTAAPQGRVQVLPGKAGGPTGQQMPIWECRDIVREDPDWPRHPEKVAFMRQCGVYPPRPRAY